MVTLPNELWVPILGHQRLPVPAPRSRVPRSGLGKQPDLCSCARVCKLFAEISQRLIYLHIATDRLELVFPSSPADIPSKRRLLSHTRSLFIEYCSKQEQPSYDYLLRNDGGWKLIGMAQDAMDYLTLGMCGDEVRALDQSFKVLAQAGPTRSVMPNLERIAVGSIYGGDDGIWRRYKEAPRMFPPMPHAIITSYLFKEFCDTSDIDSFCSHGRSGPLQAPLRAFSSDFSADGPEFLWNTHFQYTDEVAVFPIPYNSGVTWICENRRPPLVAEIAELVKLHLGEVKLERVEGRTQGQSSDCVDIELFCTVSFDNLHPTIAEYIAKVDAATLACPDEDHGSLAIERHRLYAISRSIEREFTKKSGIDVRFNWYPSYMADPCPSCDSLPPMYSLV